MYNVIKGDITTLTVDAIVNAANNNLMPGGGVCGAIFNRAGDSLINEMENITENFTKSFKDGSATISNAYNITNTKYIIHAVGPRYIDGNHNEDIHLKNAYTNSVITAHEANCTSIAFPFISSDIFGYPKLECAMIANDTLSYLSKQFPMIDITLCLFLDEDVELFNKLS
jgi:O-acetyl-ADP-ribose deacetylase